MVDVGDITLRQRSMDCIRKLAEHKHMSNLLLGLLLQVPALASLDDALRPGSISQINPLLP